MLKAKGIFKSFPGASGAVEVLSNVNIEVPDGVFFTLLGASGCGKTTLLRCVAGLERPDQGSMHIDNQLVFDGGNARRFVPAEDRPIGMVFQSYAIWPHMTVFENAAYSLRYGRYRPPRARIPDLVGEMLAKVGLSGYAKRWATELSGGQQQRLALARALLGRPKLLLLDEPLSNLDSKLRVLLRAELKAIQRDSGVTTLYVTHDMREAMSLSDTMAVINSGRVEQVGTPEEVYGRPETRFVAEFVGEANLLSGKVVAVAPGSARVRVPFGELACDVRGQRAGTEIDMCIRPEDVLIEPLGRQPAMTPANSFVGHVIQREYLGEHISFTIDVGEKTLLVRADRTHEAEPGDSVVVTLPARAVYSITPPGEPGAEADAQPGIPSEARSR
jgi:iron(III) transport system ATP-binding protein